MARSVQQSPFPTKQNTSSVAGSHPEVAQNAREAGILVSAEEIVTEARKGRMYILVDAPNRENEGDLIISAEFADAAAINFMATHGRGLICLSMTQGQADALELTKMSEDNSERFGTAFTKSIEARDGVTTGISAQDRAVTVAAAIAKDASAGDIVSPGHMFPIIARDGGVLVRAGHTEASVDVSRLAEHSPAAVICEILNDDGTMARFPQLVEYARKHGLKIGTIEDLIAYRLTREALVEKLASGDFRSQDGDEFQLHAYRNVLDGVEQLALSKGQADPAKPSLVRVHRVDFAGDILHEDSEHSGRIQTVLRQLAAYDGHAVMVLIIRLGSIGALLERLGANTASDEQEATGKDHVVKEYGVGAKILKDLGVSTMTLITDREPKLVGLAAYDLELAGIVPIGG